MLFCNVAKYAAGVLQAFAWEVQRFLLVPCATNYIGHQQGAKELLHLPCLGMLELSCGTGSSAEAVADLPAAETPGKGDEGPDRCRAVRAVATSVLGLCLSWGGIISHKLFVIHSHFPSGFSSVEHSQLLPGITPA